MKASLLASAALFSSYAGGVLVFAGHFWTGAALAVFAVLLVYRALGSARSALSRQMMRDLRSFEALLDRKEFDHGRI